MIRPLLLLCLATIADPVSASYAAPAGSLHVKLPDNADMFRGPGADAINNNCLACHSADMISNQPALTKAAWQGEIAKMIDAYKAPVPANDIAAIVDYLEREKGKP